MSMTKSYLTFACVSYLISLKVYSMLSFFCDCIADRQCNGRCCQTLSPQSAGNDLLLMFNLINVKYGAACLDIFPPSSVSGISFHVLCSSLPTPHSDYKCQM